MVLPNNNRNQLDELKSTLENLKSKADKSKIQEEYLLKQLNKEFEVESFEEAVELLNMFLEEREEYNFQIGVKTNKLIQGMKKEGII